MDTLEKESVNGVVQDLDYYVDTLEKGSVNGVVQITGANCRTVSTSGVRMVNTVENNESKVKLNDIVPSLQLEVGQLRKCHLKCLCMDRFRTVNFY